MLTSEDLLSRKGKQLKKIDNQVYRFGRKIRSGDIWRCVQKMCKAKVLINGNSITPEGIEHNHSKSYKSSKAENQKKFENSSQYHYVETSDEDNDDDDDLNGLQEEQDSTKKLFHFEEHDNEKTLNDKATDTQKSVRSIGVNTIESSGTHSTTGRLRRRTRSPASCQILTG